LEQLSEIVLISVSNTDVSHKRPNNPNKQIISLGKFEGRNTGKSSAPSAPSYKVSYIIFCYRFLEIPIVSNIMGDSEIIGDLVSQSQAASHLVTDLSEKYRCMVVWDTRDVGGSWLGRMGQMA
jgi:hypothetical protein